MSEHRRYLEYLISQDPRGKASRVMMVRHKYRRDGEKALPPRVTKATPPPRTPVPLSSGTPPPLPTGEWDLTVSPIEHELNALASELITNPDQAELKRKIAEIHGRGVDRIANQRLGRFEIFLRNRASLKQLGHEHPFWQPMLEGFTRLWLAPAAEQESIREELINQRLMLLSSNGMKKLFQKLHEVTPELARQERPLFDKMINPSAANTVARETTAPSPHRQSSSGRHSRRTGSERSRHSERDRSGGGFRWYYIVIGIVIIKLLKLLALNANI